MRNTKKFPANFYVRFYYKEGTDMCTWWTKGPHYAPFQNRNEAGEHAEFLSEDKPDICRVQILTGQELSREKEGP